MDGTELWLVRHARVTVTPGTCYGRLDVAADPAHTHTCARLLAQALADSHRHSPMPLVLHASPAGRAQALADALRLSLPPGFATDTRTDDRLAEMDFGEWEGRPWDSIGQAAMEAWTHDFHRHRPGNGESVASLLSRVAAALNALHQATEPQRVVWFTHAGVIRAVEVLTAKTPWPLKASDWPQSACEPGTWQVLSGAALDPADRRQA